MSNATLSRQAAAAVVFGGLIAASLASCRDVLVGEPIDAAAGICKLLQDCYGDQYSCEAIDADLRAASPEVRAQFLEGFDVTSCLASCPGARACLDTAPFCSAAGSCEFDNDCCGWSGGEAACGEGPTANQCCKPNGVACGEDDLCCDAHCDKGLCGGYACTVVTQACEKDTDCCSLFCQDLRCAIKSCSFLGEPCETVDDCCPVDFAATEGVTQECIDQTCQVSGEPPCFLEGDMCTVAGNECCGELGLSCIPFDGEQGFCGDNSCPGFGQQCTSEGTCCEGFECDFSGVCVEEVQCNDVGEPCVDLFDCCGTFDCVNSECVESDCEPSDCHSPCEIGPPMSVCNDDPGVAQCIALVAAADYFCSCYGWDSYCVGAAYDDCFVCPL